MHWLEKTFWWTMTFLITVPVILLWIKFIAYLLKDFP